MHVFNHVLKYFSFFLSFITFCFVLFYYYYYFFFCIEPDQPEDLRASANSSSELVIDWKPPINPNGIVTHYIVTGSWRKDDQDYFDKLDTCAERKNFIL
jgi:hypothetical protein